MPASSPVNLDDLFSRRIDENLDKAVLVPFVWGGVEYHLTNTASHAALLTANQDPMGYVKRLVVPEERDAFEQSLRDTDGMDDGILIDLINKLGEMLTSVPTLPPAHSATTSRKRTSSTGSRAT